MCKENTKRFRVEVETTVVNVFEVSAEDEDDAYSAALDIVETLNPTELIFDANVTHFVADVEEIE